MKVDILKIFSHAVTVNIIIRLRCLRERSQNTKNIYYWHFDIEKRIAFFIYYLSFPSTTIYLIVRSIQFINIVTFHFVCEFSLDKRVKSMYHNQITVQFGMLEVMEKVSLFPFSVGVIVRSIRLENFKANFKVNFIVWLWHLFRMHKKAYGPIEKKINDTLDIFEKDLVKMSVYLSYVKPHRIFEVV